MISIIIPARNEEAHLGATLTYLRQHSPHPSAEIIVAEAGSLDGTADAARHWASVVHAHARPRAALTNSGPRVARGAVLSLLLAARVPASAFLLLIQAAL